jgi:hypothetical protein
MSANPPDKTAGQKWVVEIGCYALASSWARDAHVLCPHHVNERRALTMNTINAFEVSMRVAGAARALPAVSDFAAWPALATAHAQAAAAATAHAPAAAVEHKRRTASTAFVDGGSL